MRKKVIIVHPERQHSYHTAIAIERMGYLDKYITTVYNQKGSLTYFFQKVFKGKNQKKASMRRNDNIPDEKILRIYEPLAFISLMLVRFPSLKKIYNKWRRVLNILFVKKVIKYLKYNDVDAIIAYDFTGADILFKSIKEIKPSIKCILDVSIANRAFMKLNYEKDMEKTGLTNLKKEQELLWNRNIISQVKREVEYADYYFAPSQIVKESLLFCNAQEEKIYIVPYGVDINKFKYNKRDKKTLPLELIYVGEISYRKGLHHLLDVVSKYNVDEVNISLAGAINVNSEIYNKYSKYKNIKFLGFVTQDVLTELYNNKDVFVFATLGEGYGLVVLEALSCGLPVICSSLAGGNDAIIQGYNGFVFDGGNDEQLKEYIDWFLNNLEKLPILSYNARKSVENFTWDHYYQQYKDYLSDILD